MVVGWAVWGCLRWGLVNDDKDDDDDDDGETNDATCPFPSTI